jgi:hypothetical protein
MTLKYLLVFCSYLSSLDEHTERKCVEASMYEHMVLVVMMKAIRLGKERKFNSNIHDLYLVLN